MVLVDEIEISDIFLDNTHHNGVKLDKDDEAGNDDENDSPTLI